jgi:hypothetical protein
MSAGPGFKPSELIFAPTGRCNLACAHCRVARGATELSATEAIAFMDDCLVGAKAGLSAIERVGFSGGEPFLRPDFLEAVIAAAVDRGLLFDRLMTNADWWESLGELSRILGRVADAGFDGVLGLSYDAFHGQDRGRVETFLKAWFEATGRRDGVEILSVRAEGEGGAEPGSLEDRAWVAQLSKLAEALGGELEFAGGAAASDGAVGSVVGPAPASAAASGSYGGAEPLRIVDEAWRRRKPADPDDGAGLSIPILRFTRSYGADESGSAGAWSAEAWFEDDYCEGPGQLLYVHPDGRVAPCCGFANERPELILGHIRDGYTALIEAAARLPQPRACYELGLGARRAKLEAGGLRFPGRTQDICFFCDWLCSKGLG